MKITIEYDTREDAEAALHAWTALSSLEEIDNYCRGQLKHCELSEETEKHLDRIREMVFRLPNI